MASLWTTCLLPLSLCACLFGQAGANAFLRKTELESVDIAQVEFQLLDELEGALGQAHRQATERRIARLEDALRPTVAALPKDANGNLDHMAVRYTLHRVFVEKHAWYVQHLTPSGGAENEFLPSAMLQGQVPDTIFETRLNNRTFGLHELAVLAATLENLVHEESVKRLQDAYEAQGIAVNSVGISEEQVEKAILTYLVMYILKAPASTAVRAVADDRKIKKTYPEWLDTVEFVREIRNEVFDRYDANTSSITFQDTIKVVEEFNERYGRWQDRECRELKHNLVKMEIPGTGRVLLKDFYTSGQWQFSETAPYLRQMGALDDSDPTRLKVIIPNYVNAPSNCLAASSFYSVCCIDECEALLGQIERKISAPEATPERIAEVVSTLPSSTVDAPRELPTSLRSRLDEIAVPSSLSSRRVVVIHSRRFQQFLHHAFPRECNFPHVTGTIRPLTTTEWKKEMNLTSVKATREEVQQHVENTAAREPDNEEELPWTSEEELFCPLHAPKSPTNRNIVQSLGRSIVFIALLLSISLTIFRKAAMATASVKVDSDKVFV